MKESNNQIDFLGCFKDSDGTIKNIFRFRNRDIIEMSLIGNKENMDVVCVPTHHFCNLGYKMYHLTNSSLKKEMIKVEVEDFMYSLDKTVCYDNGIRRTFKKKLLISFMGVGEPL